MPSNELEPLEARRLFAISIVDDTLVVEGTGSTDTVTLSLDPADANSVRVNLNSDTPQSFNFLDIQGGILINVGASNDTVSVDESLGLVLAQTTVVGGDGDDVILMGSGSDRISGGIGNDVISSGPGRDFVYGADGDDVIDTGGNSDYVQGNAGTDTITGAGGNDR